MSTSTPIRSFRWLWLAYGLALLTLGTALLLDRVPHADLLFDPAGHLPREMTAFGILVFAGFWFGALFGAPYHYHSPVTCPLCRRVFQPGEARLNHCPDCRIPLKPQSEADKESCPGQTEDIGETGETE